MPDVTKTTRGDFRTGRTGPAASRVRRGAPRLLVTMVTAALGAVLPAAGGEKPDVSLEAVVRDARSHLVPVEIELRKDKGEYPGARAGLRRFGGYSGRSYIDRRVPMRLPGLVWDSRHVLVPDACPPARFVKSVSVVIDGKKTPAEFSGYFRRAACALVEVDVELPGRKALEFAPAPEDPFALLVSAAFAWEGAGWRAAANVVGGDFVTRFGTPSGEVGTTTWTPPRGEVGTTTWTPPRGEVGTTTWTPPRGERSFRTLHGPALLYDEKGRLVGYSASGRLRVKGQGEPWRGTDLRRAEIVPADRLERALDELRGRLGRLALEVRLTFRREEKKERRDMFSFRRRSFHTAYDSDRDAESNEWHGTGFVIGPDRALVPADIGREHLVRTAKIEMRAALLLGEAEFRPARFVGALRDLGAIVIEPEGQRFAEWLDVSAGAEFRHDELFISAAIDHATGKRRVRSFHDRLAGWEEGFEGRIRPSVRHGAREGLAAFTLLGDFLGLALSVRLPPGGERYKREFEGPNLLTASFVSGVLGRPDPYDAALEPLAKEQEKRIVWLGVEFQRLTPDLARACKAEVSTRAGKLGLLVSHVYRGSPAERLGLKKRDVLLRFEPEGGGPPVDLEGDLAGTGGQYAGFMPMLDEIPEEYRARFMAEMPPPWPAQLSGFNDLLTKLGAGKKVKLTYLREGRASLTTFALSYAPPHFQSTPPFKAKDIGLTVKEITYEVRQYYRLSDEEPGLVIAGVEPGGKGALGKMFPYSLIRRVNGSAVRKVSEFKEIYEGVKSGSAGTTGLRRDEAASAAQAGVLEITVEHFGKTRLVKIKL